MRHTASSVNFMRAWEESSGISDSFKALVSLAGHLLFRPLEVFKSLSDTGQARDKKRVMRALIFAFVFGYLRLAADSVHIYWFQYLAKKSLSVPTPFDLSPTLIAMFGSPFFLLRPIISFVVTVMIVGFSVKLILGFQKSLTPVLLVVCYKSACEIFNIIPGVGVLLAGIWSVALLAVGIKELYATSMLRSVLTTVMMPFLMLLFIFLSMGASLSKAISSLYPEAQKQITKLNDTNAYFYAKAIGDAAQAYKQDLGFYPVHLGVLKKYIPGSFVDDLTNSGNFSGYTYDYAKSDDDHFILMVRPVQGKNEGRYVFYVDETATIRLNDRQGPLVQNIEALDQNLPPVKQKDGGAL